MGFLNNLLGAGNLATAVGNAVRSNTEVFHANETDALKLDAAQFQSVLAQYQSEFMRSHNWFESIVDGLNRLPRPAMALGTIGLFVYAMADPAGFSLRMSGLALIPEPLWWLLGAIVGFYFGAREMYHFRNSQSNFQVALPKVIETAQEQSAIEISPTSATALDISKVAKTAKTKDNAAILEWLEHQNSENNQ